MRLLRSALLLTVVLVSAAPVPSSITSAQKQTAETATQFYLRWRSTALKAKSMIEITPFWTAETIDEFNMEPEPARADALAMMKRLYGGQAHVKVVKETATPTGATLSLEGQDGHQKPIVSSVDVVQEKGAWKMTAAVEQWKPKSKSASLPRFPSLVRIPLFAPEVGN
jgi:hypothetical protein